MNIKFTPQSNIKFGFLKESDHLYVFDMESLRELLLWIRWTHNRPYFIDHGCHKLDYILRRSVIYPQVEL